MTADRRRQHVLRVCGTAAVLLSLGVAGFAYVVSRSPSDVVAASRIAAQEPGAWIGEAGAWQWDALLGAGVVQLAVAVLLVTVARRDELAAAVCLLSWTGAAGALVGLVWHASTNTGGALALVLVALGALLTATILATRREHATPGAGR